MRKAFVKNLIKLAEKDKNIFLLTGDLGFHALEDFALKFPDRFINCGVAEQNMMGVAAGLALCGKKPYVYSIIPFVTLRCLEQIRNDVCYQNLDVKIFGVGGGFSYSTLGVTHSVMEDLAIMRTLPNMSVFSPSDSFETEELVLKSYENKGPAYFRLSNAGQFKVYDKAPDIKMGELKKIKDGVNGVVIATGLMVPVCFDILKNLKEEKNIDLKLLSAHTLKPFDKNSLMSEINGFDKVFVFEEHSIVGGLGSMIAEILAESEYSGFFKRIGADDKFVPEIGTADYLRKKYIMKEGKVIEEILNNFK